MDDTSSCRGRRRAREVAPVPHARSLHCRSECCPQAVRPRLCGQGWDRQDGELSAHASAICSAPCCGRIKLL